MNLIKPFSARVFAKEINPIISKSRKISLHEAKFKSYLQSNEVIEFMEEMGYPIDDIGRRIQFQGLTITKKKLRAKLHTMSQPEFDERLSSIVAENRKNSIQKVRSCQYLRYNEVVSFLLSIGEKLPRKE
ncbi:MAG: hypothetical protein ACE37L_07280 [Allomuricauda sp.]